MVHFVEETAYRNVTTPNSHPGLTLWRYKAIGIDYNYNQYVNSTFYFPADSGYQFVMMEMILYSKNCNKITSFLNDCDFCNN